MAELSGRAHSKSAGNLWNPIKKKLMDAAANVTGSTDAPSSAPKRKSVKATTSGPLSKKQKSASRVEPVDDEDSDDSGEA